MTTGRWVLAFMASATLAGAMVVATLSPEVLLPRSSAELSDIEIELLIHKMREGDLLAIAKDLDGARRAWADVRRRGAGIWMVHEGMGDSLCRANLGAEALREYGVAAELAPPGPAVAALAAKRGRILAELDRPLDALRTFVEAYPIYDRQSFQELARRVGAPDVMRICRARTEVDPRAWALLADVGALFQASDVEAEGLAQYFIRFAPWNEGLAAEALGVLGKVGRTELALDVCRAWAKALPASIEAWRRMGDLLRAAGRDKEALAAYTSIVDVRPGQADAHRALAGIFLEWGRREDAVAQWEAARRARPEDRQTWADLLAAADEARGDRLAAEALLKFPGDPVFSRRLHEARQREIARLPKVEAVAFRRALAAKGVSELGLYDLKIILTWDVAADVDLDVHEPGGVVVFHGRKESPIGGRYYVDDTRGRGPETYTLAVAPPGTYQAGVHLHGDTRSTAVVVIVLYEGTSRELRRTETVTLEQAGDQRLFPPFEIR